MKSLEIFNLCKSFADHAVFNNFNLKIPNGEIVAIYGPNGCGKTTLLHLLSGIEKADHGDIKFCNININEVPLGIVFQNYSEYLLPWKTTIKNIFLPEQFRKKIPNESILGFLSKAQKDRFRTSYPYELSGGQQQLCSVLRAFSGENSLVLLDEPFSSLDLKTKEQACDVILKNKNKNRLIILVTHDLIDAIYLSDRLILFKNNPIADQYMNIRINSKFKNKKELLHSSYFNDIYKQTLEYLEV